MRNEGGIRRATRCPVAGQLCNETSFWPHTKSSRLKESSSAGAKRSFLTKFVSPSLILMIGSLGKLFGEQKLASGGKATAVTHSRCHQNARRLQTRIVELAWKLNSTRGGAGVRSRKCSSARQPKWGWGISPVKLSSFHPPSSYNGRRPTHCYGPPPSFQVVIGKDGRPH